MLRFVVLTALLAGLRRSEIFALHWTDDKKDPRSYVDFDNDVVRVRKAVFFRHGRHLKPQSEDEAAYLFTAPKSKMSVRDVPLSPALKKELQAYYLRAKDKEGLVFQTANGTPVDPNNVCRWKPEPKAKDEQGDQDGGKPQATACPFY
jgi:integrase